MATDRGLYDIRAQLEADLAQARARISELVEMLENFHDTKSTLHRKVNPRCRMCAVLDAAKGTDA